MKRRTVLWQSAVKRKWLIGVIFVLSLAAVIWVQHDKNIRHRSPALQQFKTKHPLKPLPPLSADIAERHNSLRSSLPNDKLPSLKQQAKTNGEQQGKKFVEDFPTEMEAEEGTQAESRGTDVHSFNDHSEQAAATGDNISAEPQGTPLFTPEEETILAAIDAEWKSGNLTHERALYLMALEKAIRTPKNSETLVIDNLTGKRYLMPAGTDQLIEIN